jgi:hypothetical protein
MPNIGNIVKDFLTARKDSIHHDQALHARSRRRKIEVPAAAGWESSI